MHVCCRFADGDEVDYHAFLAGINWVEHLAPPVMPEDTLRVRERNSNTHKTKGAEKWGQKNFLDKSEWEKHSKWFHSVCADF